MANQRTAEGLDGDKLRETARTVFGAFSGAVTSAMIYLGDRLGLYRALAEVDSFDSHELAAETGLSERWVREWLHQQGAAAVLEHRGDGRFALSAEAVAVLANESHPAFGAGFFSHFPQSMQLAEKLPEAFQTGLGLPYDALGPEGAVSSAALRPGSGRCSSRWHCPGYRASSRNSTPASSRRMSAAARAWP